MMETRRARDLLPLLVGGLLAGILAGLLLGELLAGALSGLGSIAGQDERFRDDYVLMVATVYVTDGNLAGAWRRLQRVAGGDSVAWLLDTAEGFIARSRDVQDIRRLVALAEGLGRLTPAMEPFRLGNTAESAP